jgi:glycosyltransferase involved in cell wall biosynthesis
MKFAFLSDALPPGGSGQAIVIGRLLEALEPATYCLISSRDLTTELNLNTPGRGLPGKYVYLPPEKITRGYRLGLAKIHGRRFFSLVSKLRARKIARIIQAEKCEAIIACTDNLVDVPAGYQASQQTGARFYAYVFDDYGRKWLSARQLAFAQSVEPIAFRNATNIIVPNEFMREVLRARYGVEAMLIRNPCDLTRYEAPRSQNEAQVNSSEPSIVYTGAVYDAQYNAIRDLLVALEHRPQLKARLHLYSVFAREKLIAAGLRSEKIVYHDPVPPMHMPDIQRKADILFLPLTFRSAYPELINTSSPGKMGEYLAARRPILVYAPPDSFVAWYFREHECGLVVDSEDPALIAQALERLLSDEKLRRKLSAQAWERARSDFSVDEARTRFAQLLGVEAQRLK